MDDTKKEKVLNFFFFFDAQILFQISPGTNIGYSKPVDVPALKYSLRRPVSDPVLFINGGRGERSVGGPA